MLAARDSLKHLRTLKRTIDYALRGSLVSTWKANSLNSSAITTVPFIGTLEVYSFLSGSLFTASCSSQLRFVNSKSVLRQISSAAPKGPASETKLENLMAKRLGRRAGDQFMYAVSLLKGLLTASSSMKHSKPSVYFQFIGCYCYCDGWCNLWGSSALQNVLSSNWLRRHSSRRKHCGGKTESPSRSRRCSVRGSLRSKGAYCFLQC